MQQRVPTATEDPAAVRWNDVSVNENGHLHALLRLTRECGVLGGFADEERRACRATLGRLVLSTDMAHHAKLLEDFVDAATDAMETASMNAAAIDENGNEEEEVASVASWSDPVLALCYVLHRADISNPARPWRLAREWGAHLRGVLQAGRPRARAGRAGGGAQRPLRRRRDERGGDDGGEPNRLRAVRRRADAGRPP